MKLLFLFILFFSPAAFALDNPDAPDYIGEFEARILPFENYINKKAQTTLEYSEGYDNLYVALDKELNTAYKLLITKLDKPEKDKLRKSQKLWIKYRDGEFDFISSNFDRSHFGSSSVLSYGRYRASIVESRVKKLLYYLINY